MWGQWVPVAGKDTAGRKKQSTFRPIRPPFLASSSLPQVLACSLCFPSQGERGTHQPAWALSWPAESKSPELSLEEPTCSPRFPGQGGECTGCLDTFRAGWSEIIPAIPGGACMLASVPKLENKANSPPASRASWSKITPVILGGASIFPTLSKQGGKGNI